eukprot:Opistho-2@27347
MRSSCVQFIVVAIAAILVMSDIASADRYKYFVAGPNGVVRACTASNKCKVAYIGASGDVAWAANMPMPLPDNAMISSFFNFRPDSNDVNKVWAISDSGVDISTDNGANFKKLAVFNCDKTCAK